MSLTRDMVDLKSMVFIQAIVDQRMGRRKNALLKRGRCPSWWGTKAAAVVSRIVEDDEELTEVDYECVLAI